MRLQEKTAIVTGGASGFGEGIVRKFLAEGARVVIADLNGEAANALAGELGDHTSAVTADVSKLSTIGFERSRIAIPVFVKAKLQLIDKDTRHNTVRACPSM